MCCVQYPHSRSLPPPWMLAFLGLTTTSLISHPCFWLSPLMALCGAPLYRYSLHWGPLPSYGYKYKLLYAAEFPGLTTSFDLPTDHFILLLIIPSWMPVCTTKLTFPKQNTFTSAHKACPPLPQPLLLLLKSRTLDSYIPISSTSIPSGNPVVSFDCSHNLMPSHTPTLGSHLVLSHTHFKSPNFSTLYLAFYFHPYVLLSNSRFWLVL